MQKQAPFLTGRVWVACLNVIYEQADDLMRVLDDLKGGCLKII